MRSISSRRAIAATLCVTGALVVGACNDFLRVDNPGAIEAPELSDPRYVTLLQNGAVGQFQSALGQTIIYGSTFTDEARNHHVFFENKAIDRRDMPYDNGTFNIMYVALQRARFMGDSGAGQIRATLGAAADVDPRYARARAYAGYAYVLLGETFCETAVNLSAPHTSKQIFTDFAVPQFKEAIRVARAAKAVATAGSAAARTADSLIVFASIGAARAALDAGDNATAISFATDPLIVADSASGYAWRMYANYSSNSATENNPIWAVIAAGAGSGSRYLSLTSTPFAATNDPRVPHADTTYRMQDAINAVVVRSPSAYSSWGGVNDTLGMELTFDTDIRIAGTLEARYIRAEAEGPTAANIAFIESRRAIATRFGDNTVPPTDANNYYSNVMDERAREFFMDAHRLGDLRRFKEFHGLDKWQRGPYPNTTTGEQYGPAECFPIPASEVNGNPNIPKP